MRIKYHALWLLVGGVLLVGCATPAPATPQAVPQETAPTAVQPTPLPADVTPKMVEELRATGAIVIIDVREADEYAVGHIPGAVLIPLGALPDRLDEVPTDKPVVMVCRSGSRSAQAVQILHKAGFTNVHNMTGGMNAWLTAGYVPEAER
ncbi:MAG TPA: rhodanese-like domain-containing protein [Anaerolineae bacterium]|nr:rhodanese-like domain-containing protein [Anaerolineae bacterium]HQH36961.1 rhodanese-like domain-containing protein [Anaerolineae bacterium]